MEQAHFSSSTGHYGERLPMERLRLLTCNLSLHHPSCLVPGPAIRHAVVPVIKSVCVVVRVRKTRTEILKSGTRKSDSSTFCLSTLLNNVRWLMRACGASVRVKRVYNSSRKQGNSPLPALWVFRGRIGTNRQRSVFKGLPRLSA